MKFCYVVSRKEGDDVEADCGFPPSQAGTEVR